MHPFLPLFLSVNLTQFGSHKMTFCVFGVAVNDLVTRKERCKVFQTNINYSTVCKTILD